MKRPNKASFGKMLFDLNNYVSDKVGFVILDAIVAMEGDGPSAGTPRKLGYVLFGTDTLSVDSIACRLISLDVKNVPYLNYAYDKGMLDDVSIIGNFKPVSDFVLPGQRKRSFLSRSKEAFGFVANTIPAILNNRSNLKPNVNRDKCIGCGICVSKCPAKAITVSDKIAHIDESKCIRCFVCHEVCPEHAMEI